MNSRLLRQSTQFTELANLPAINDAGSFFCGVEQCVAVIIPDAFSWSVLFAKRVGSNFMSHRMIESLEDRALFAATLFANLQTAGLEPQNITAYGSKVLFTGQTGTAGRELWISDGTSAGTKQLKDINPGITTSNVHQILFGASYAYFVATDETGYGLWRTDGTAGGTLRLTYLNDSYSAFDLPTISTEIYQNKLYFDNGHSLWRTDGSVAGTTEVKNFGAILGYGEESQTLDIEAAGSNLYVLLGDNQNETIYRSNGTSAGTTLVAAVNNSTDLNSIGADLFFSGKSAGKTGLWKVGTDQKFTRLSSVTANSGFAVDGSAAYFLGAGSVGSGLFKLSGVDVQIVAGGNYGGYSTPVIVNHKVIIPSGFSNDLPIYDPAAKEIVLLNELNSGVNSVRHYKVIGSQIYFTAVENESVFNLWKSDGTEAGTKKIGVVPTDQWSDYQFEFAVVGSKFYFPGLDATSRQELFSSTTSATGAAIVFDQLAVDYPLSIASLGAAGGKLFAISHQGSDPFGGSTFDYLWQSDGVSLPKIVGKMPYGYAQGATFHQLGSRVLMITTGGGNYIIDNGKVAPLLETVSNYMGIVNNKAVFTGNSQIFFTDGTAAGTTSNYLPESSEIVGDLVANGSTAYFTVRQYWSDFKQIWKTDGTPENTVAVDLPTAFYEGTEKRIGEIAVLNGQLFATISVYDGEASTTFAQIVKFDLANDKFTILDLREGALSEERKSILGTINGGFVMDLGGPESGVIWTNGTTKRVLISGADYHNVYEGVTNNAGQFYFKEQSYFDSVGRLWSTDGTVANTKQVTGVNRVDRSAIVNSKLFVSDGETQTLYQVDGTKATVAEKLPALTDGGDLPIGNFAALDGKLFFTGYSPNGTHGIFSYTPTTTPPTVTHSIAGVVYNDVNKNGKQDAGELSVSGLRVFIDANNNGGYDAGEKMMLTDSKGAYYFDNLAKAVYNLRVTVPLPWKPVGAKTAKLTFAGSPLTQSFGVSK